MLSYKKDIYIDKELNNIKSGILHEIFDSWCDINYEYITAHNFCDSMYWYNERASVGSLAGAIWRTGGLALEEFSANKSNDENKEMGRIDLYFTQNDICFIAEAKQKFISLSDNINFYAILKNKLDEAIDDTKRTSIASDYEHVPLALLFVVPFFVNNTDPDNNRIKLESAIKCLGASFYVNFKIEKSNIINNNDGVYNQVVLIGKCLIG